MRELLAVVVVSLLAGGLFGVAGPARPEPVTPAAPTEITALRETR